MIQTTVEQRLRRNGHQFDFFQAVRLIQQGSPRGSQIGGTATPQAELARFKTRLSLAFPPSSIHEAIPPKLLEGQPQTPWTLVQSFMGLVGSSGVLPTHYTELAIRLQREIKFGERDAFIEWLDVFTHRWVSLFYRAWEKYRFYIPFERGEHKEKEPDAFTLGLLSLVGLGFPSLRDRFQFRRPKNVNELPSGMPDLSLLRYASFFARGPRTALGLEQVLQAYFQVNAEVIQFVGQWLTLSEWMQTRLGNPGGLSCRLGVNAIAGEKVWNVDSKIRIRLGPMGYQQFSRFLPTGDSNAFTLLNQLVRFSIGPTLDFDVQLVLQSQEIPPCALSGQMALGVGPLLGWNTWIWSTTPQEDAQDAIFGLE